MFKFILKNRLKNSALNQTLLLLNPIDRLKIFLMAFIQIALSFLDLIGIALFGVLGSLAITGSSARQTGDRVNSVLKSLNLENLEIQKQAAILGFLAALILISKTLLSLYLVRKTMYFLSYRSAEITKNLTAKLLRQPLQKIQERSMQQNVYALTGGVGNLTNQIVGTSILLISDLALVIVMLAGLFYVDPLISFLTVLIFGGVATSLYFSLHGRASKLGVSRGILLSQSLELIQEVFGSYRESVVGNKRQYYVQKIGSQQYGLASNSSQTSFLPMISKYVLEITIISGTVLISAVQFLTSDAARSVAVLTVFIASSTRIGPAILRIQQSAIQIKGGIGMAKPSLELMAELKHVELLPEPASEFNTNHGDDWGSIEIKDLRFRYKNSHIDNLSSINLNLPFGSSTAIVGKSGAGKSTLVDLILGINIPISGSILISGMTPSEVCIAKPGALAYVPQDSIIVNGSIRANICMGYEMNKIPESEIERVLEITQLKEFVDSLPEKLDTYIGDKGARLSGGQKQRIGIARALISNPRILVLDEATSSLDSETEINISASIDRLKGNTTIVLIAHRLSTVRTSDKVVYLNEGKVVATGKFEEVRAQVPDFDLSAKLMGL
jgi:ABC-type multidrug transport system fused ATPase/permease subunit